ncbi:hypothetical protein ACFQDN_21330 [Pseudomonas asuensis]
MPFLNGQKKCTRGESHRAAVLLGLKEGVIFELMACPALRKGFFSVAGNVK